MLRTFRCDGAEWIPVAPYLFPNENPTVGVPEALRTVLDSSSGDLAGDHLKLGEYLGAEDYFLPVTAPAELVSDIWVPQVVKEGIQTVLTLPTPRGDLRQVTVYPEGAPPAVTERFLKTVEDVERLIAWFETLRVVKRPKRLEEVRRVRERLGDRGVVFCRIEGTPLGMCYRVYAHLEDLIYLLADHPEVMENLFEIMEDRYEAHLKVLLEIAPEIDVFMGMDDTSTTLISPAMFERYSVEPTNRRADLCHAHCKLYLHHSCGLIRDLLPVYRKTRMDGVDAFTPPPTGNVTYSEGRRLLGPRISLRSGLAGGLRGVTDPVCIREHVEERMRDALSAGSVVFLVGGASLTFPAMARLFEEAQRFKRSY